MAKLTIRATEPGMVIDKNIYGHFSEHLGRCIYEGYWVGEDSPIPNVRGIRQDVVEALREMRVPVLRWPGGCFADEYHWLDGVGPREQRKRMVNTHWGGVIENNHFGTHEFLDLCEQIGCEPYICGNLGSGTVREMQEWVEYITFDGVSPMADMRRKNGREEPWRLKYFGVGNENWGCGGNMRPEYYADEYRRYNTYLRNFGENVLYRIACGANSADYNWTEVMMKNAGEYMDGLSVHYYTMPTDYWYIKTSATDFDEEEYFTILRRGLLIEGLIKKHAQIMDQYDPQKRVAIIFDEWGAWYKVEPGTNPGFLYQQNTIRDALLAAISFNVFNAHCDRVRMANIAQTINVLQAVILTDGDRMIKTPTYHAFRMFSRHQDAKLLPHTLDCGVYAFGAQSVPAVSVSCSLGADGRIFVTAANLNPHHPESLLLTVDGKAVLSVSQETLTASEITAHNTFDAPETVSPIMQNSAAISDGAISVTLPPMSVNALTIS